MAGITTIGLGVVFVLLLGEIDLSVGYVSGVCGVIAAKLVEPAGTASGWPVHTDGLVAIVVALLAGAAIGLLQGRSSSSSASRRSSSRSPGSSAGPASC